MAVDSVDVSIRQFSICCRCLRVLWQRVREWKVLRQEAELAQRGALVPADVLVVELVATEVDYGGEGEGGMLEGWRDTREKPRDVLVMSELEEELVDDAIDADGATEQFEFGVGGVGEDEAGAVEVS